MNSIAITTISEQEPHYLQTQSNLCAQAERAIINTTQDAEKCGDLCKWVKTARTKIEADRRSITDPINQTIREINARYNRLTDPLKEAEIALRGKIKAFLVKQAQAQQLSADERALEQCQALHAAGDALGAESALTIATAAPVRAQTTRGDFGSVTSLRDRWTFAVTDIAALAAARPDLVQINPVAMNKAIREGLRECEGVRIFNERTVAVR